MKAIADHAAIVFCMLMVSGCISTGNRQQKTKGIPASHGSVRTEGHLIKNKTIVIPPEGLTLVDVVEQCERKVTSENRFRSPMVKELSSLKRAQNDPVKQAVQMLSDAITTLQADESNAVLSKNVESAKEDLVKQMKQTGVELGQSNESLVARLASSLTVETNEKKRNELVADFNNSMPQNKPSPSESDDVQENRSSTPLVILSRRSGRRIIVPILLVKGWIAGDIALADGDQISIVPKEGCSAFTREGGEEASQITIALTGLTERSELAVVAGNTDLQDFIEGNADSGGQTEAYANIVVLQSLTDSGQMEEYILPLTNSPAFQGIGNELNQIVSSVQLQDGDHFHFSALELTPLLLASRSKNRIMQREALESNIREDSHDRIHANLASCKESTSRWVSNTWQSIPKPNFLGVAGGAAKTVRSNVGAARSW